MVEACLVFDLGKTNKKVFVFNQKLEVIYSDSIRISRVLDEDGDLVEDLQSTINWVKEKYSFAKHHKDFKITAVNCCGYASALVFVNEHGQPLLPFYGDSKTFGYKLKKSFLEEHGSVYEITRSPNLGILNAGHQLFWLEKSKTEKFRELKFALSLPQFIMSIFHGEFVQEYTTIGCHSLLWDFEKSRMADWTSRYSCLQMPVLPSSQVYHKDNVSFGIGIHDKSAVLLPYLKEYKEPFILLATGTWTTTFNPNEVDANFSTKEFQKGCLTYLLPDGKTLKASRLFSGDEHNRVTQHLAIHFNKPLDYFKEVQLDPKILRKLRSSSKQFTPAMTGLEEQIDCPFMDRSLNSFQSYEEAYHQFLLDLVAQQIHSILQTMGSQVIKDIVVEGGFSQNELFISLLQEAFFNLKIRVNKDGSASARGAALAIKEAWMN